jgi:SAM-dependent methyltransferase
MSEPGPAQNWRSFWDGAHSIYVNARHRDLHYAALAADLAALVPHPQAHVLDHGCGEALASDKLAAVCGQLDLFDTAPSVRAKLATRFADVSNIRVLDEPALDALPDASVDFVVLNSVAQYLDHPQLEALLAFWHRILRPGGRLVLADVIPPGIGPLTDAAALLRFAHQGGFFGAALLGLVRTALSDYRKLRGTLGLTTYTEAEVLALLAAHGFSGTRATKNVGHNDARMTFVAARL